MVTLHIPPSAVVRFRLSRAELEEMAFLAALAAGDRERVSRLRSSSTPDQRKLRSAGMRGVPAQRRTVRHPGSVPKVVISLGVCRARFPSSHRGRR